MNWPKFCGCSSSWLRGTSRLPFQEIGFLGRRFLCLEIRPENKQGRTRSRVCLAKVEVVAFSTNTKTTPLKSFFLKIWIDLIFLHYFGNIFFFEDFFFLTSILILFPSPFRAATYFLGRTLMLSQSLFRYTLFKQLLLDFYPWSYNSPVFSVETWGV